MKRLGLGIPPLRPVKLRQIVDAGERIGMLRTPHPLLGGEGAFVKRLGLVVTPLRDKHEAQIVDANERVRMIRPQRALGQRQRLLGYCRRLLVLAAAMELERLLIECGEIARVVRPCGNDTDAEQHRRPGKESDHAREAPPLHMHPHGNMNPAPALLGHDEGGIRAIARNGSEFDRYTNFWQSTHFVLHL